jgi:hypothetical protein
VPQHLDAPGFRAGAITADLILSNGKIVTVDDRFTIAQAVAIKGKSHRGGRRQSGDGPACGAECEAHQPEGTDGHPRSDRQPQLTLLRAATTWPLELRFDGVALARKRLR